ncbi:unnamed protein product, partial [Rotaria magnacalcarata]
IKKEYTAMLNSGKIFIFGQLYDVDEFLPSPKLLICSKCNQPGHVKELLLIIELRKHHDLLPPDIQLFIPPEFREQGERTKIIFNKSAQNCQQRFDQQVIYDRNDFNLWPKI